MQDKNFKKGKTTLNFRINDEITYNGDVRVIYKPNANSNEEGFNTVMPISMAKKISQEKGLDLIEINRNVNPPILRLEDYSKYRYELKKREKQNKKTSNSLKEIQLSTNISEHDLDIKIKKAEDFILHGHKVKVILTMRGRELSRRENSKLCLYKFIDKINEIALPESMPKDENNRSIVILRKK